MIVIVGVNGDYTYKCEWDIPTHINIKLERQNK